MVNQILVLLRAVGENFEALCSEDSSGLELRSCLPLQAVLLVSKEVLPLEEAVAQVRLLVLLSVRDELEPVPHNLAHLDEGAPPVEHLRLQVVVCAVHVLPAGDGASDQFESFAIGVVRHVLNLVAREALVCHEHTQVFDVHSCVEDFFHDWADLVDLNDSLGVEGFLLPAVEGVASGLRDEVSEEKFLLHFDRLVAQDLSS
mmetsp:Transcript_23761/g.29560  ORF Transcript_23761/g.29560 Transcript_23761/m.29560 type:complete len:202 (-) Transcript_23761:4404-5009(-)